MNNIMDNVNVQSLAEKCPDVSGYNQLVLLPSLKSLTNEDFNRSYSLDGVLLVLLKKGHVQLTIDGNQCNFSENEFFACRPNVVIETAMVSVDSDAIALLVSPDYTFDLVSKSGIDWTQVFLSNLDMGFPLSPEQMKQIEMCLMLIHYNINMPETPFKSKTIDSLMLSFLYMMVDIGKLQEQLPLREQSFSPMENLMQRFFHLLADSNPSSGKGGHFLSVKEYADLLHVTPKYFSSVCKKSIGKTAGQVIDEEVVRTAKQLLQDNSLGIKQISDALGFANQSHFGSFFRRHTGLSPQHFRNGDS